MLLSQNKTILWDYIKNTKDRNKQIQQRTNDLGLSDSAKQAIQNNCDEITSELAAMRILLTAQELKTMGEWNEHKQNIAALQIKIADLIKNATLANQSPIKTKNYQA